MNPRGLTGMTSSRVADTQVSVIYNQMIKQDDGSSINVPYTDSLKGSVQALQPIDIKRLQEGGIEIKDGISLLLKEAREERPNKIIIGDVQWRPVNWAYVYEYTETGGGSGDVERGTVVAACTQITVGAAI